MDSPRTPIPSLARLGTPISSSTTPPRTPISPSTPRTPLSLIPRIPLSPSPVATPSPPPAPKSNKLRSIEMLHFMDKVIKTYESWLVEYRRNENTAEAMEAERKRKIRILMSLRYHTLSLLLSMEKGTTPLLCYAHIVIFEVIGRIDVYPTVAEAMGLRWCLCWAKDKRIEILSIKIDSLKKTFQTAFCLSMPVLCTGVEQYCKAFLCHTLAMLMDRIKIRSFEAAKGARVGDNFFVSDCDDPHILNFVSNCQGSKGAHGLFFRSFSESKKARIGKHC
ncbi:hypothetical protein TSUD_217280 [Trifolium subterraneum]|uniref:Uncharacterized protein n=1 Tax=Trifolium subterraneum TaxID=3900 RepID=A0A2Z6MPS2_TRISU|nr:hypothetical protein TSUD_217280 [Trifolium subterraneum]